MNAELKFGSKLSGLEYDHKIVTLYENLPLKPTPEDLRQVRYKELDITIDHRLGLAFPKDRRILLREVQERIERKRIWLISRYIFKSLFKKLFERGVQNLSNFVISEYATVLNHDELIMYFGEHEVAQPSLPTYKMK